VLRGRKQHQCAECPQPIEVGEWHTALVGKSKSSGKHFTTRRHQQCLWLRIGMVRANPGRGAKVQRSKSLATLDPEQQATRHKLVMLRSYHRRCGHSKRVAELDKDIEATGIVAPQRAARQAPRQAREPAADAPYKSVEDAVQRLGKRAR